MDCSLIWKKSCFFPGFVDLTSGMTPDVTQTAALRHQAASAEHCCWGEKAIKDEFICLHLSGGQFLIYGLSIDSLLNIIGQ